MARSSKNKSREEFVASPAVVVEPSPANPIAEPQSTQPVQPAAPWWKKDWFIALLFFVAVFAAYSHVFNGKFVWDDDAYIANNPWMRNLQGLHNIWFEPHGAGHQYYPLTFTVFWVAYQLWGMHPLGYHMVDAFFHALASVLLWQVLKRLKVPGALLAGALFALFPVNVMSAGWMNEIKNTFSGSLALLAIWAYIRFEGLGVYEEKAAGKRAWGWYAVAIALFLFAMLAKTAVSFLPVTVVLIVWWKRGGFRLREAWSHIWPAVPMVGVVAGMGLMTIDIEKKTSGATGADFKLGFLERLLVSGHSFFFYLGKLLLPVHLSFVYTRWELDTHDWRQYLWPLAVAATFVALWFARRRIGRAPFAAAVHFYISTSLLIFMVVLYRMQYSFVADHWIYFGSMSVFALMGAAFATGLDYLARRGIRGGPWIMGALLATLGAMTWHQCGMFADFETLWRWTLAENPQCWMAENNLGNALSEDKRYDEAIPHYQKALALKSDYALAMNNYGALLMKLEPPRIDEAVALYKKSNDIKPNAIDTLNNLGWAGIVQHRYEDAITYYRKAVAISTQMLEAAGQQPQVNTVADLVRVHLSEAYQLAGRYAEAIALDRETVRLMPDDAISLNHLARLLATCPESGSRNGIQAEAFARRAIALIPNAPLLRDTLAAAYAEEARYSDAVIAETQALAMAKKTRDAKLFNTFKTHLALYETDKPLREKN